jgi:hypothetical protein
MKKFKLLTMILALGLLFGACKKDEKDAREDYLGTYKVTEHWPGYEDEVYNMTITKSTTSGKDVIISGMLGITALSAVAQVTDNSFNIPQQTYADMGYNGYGRRNGINLNIDLQVSIAGAGMANVTLTCIRL